MSVLMPKPRYYDGPEHVAKKPIHLDIVDRDFHNISLKK